jgi:hypothetical protein
MRMLSESERQAYYTDRLPEDFRFPLFNGRQAVLSQRQSGYRTTARAAREIVDNAIEAGAMRFDAYLFDTLSGGGGYAEQAGMELPDVFAEMECRLGGCKCRSSCQDCLRHYGNRMHHERLDRFLALDLLRYVRTGQFPVTTDLDRQAEVLGALRQMLELDGQTATLTATVGGQRVPLLVEGNGRSVAVGCYPGLLDDNAESFTHPLDVLGGPDLSVRLFSEFQVTRNLPAVYIAVREALNKP